MISLWEKLSLIKKDIVIIGSGITGLSAAVYLNDRYPDSKVTVVEQGLLPGGASTKNAGFACFGSLSELIDDLFTMTPEEVTELVALRLKGLRTLIDRLGADTIDFQQHGGYELISKNDLYYLEKIDYINEMLIPLFDGRCFSVAGEKIDSFGFDRDHVAEMVYTPFEGQLDTGKMIRSLLALVRSRGTEIMTNSKVTGLSDKGDSVELMINDELKMSAASVLVATNGFISELLPDITINPGRGLVMSTRPIPDLPFQGTFHIDKGYYYFRNFENRVILGGGRNLDFEKETTTRHEVNEKILARLHELMREVILPGVSYETEMVWTGIMGFGKKKSATVRRYSENVTIGAGLGGMGVAIGSVIGEELAVKAMEG